MRTNLTILLLLLAGLILATNALSAEKVYKWTDSAGRAQYSQTPPDGHPYQTIIPSSHVVASSTAALSTTATASKPAAPSEPTPAQLARQKLCATARNNVQVLANQPLVEMDITGSGKAQQLTQAQQAEQLNKAQQQVSLLCGN